MTTKEWNFIESVVDRAMVLPEEERSDFIHSACDGDEHLIKEVHKFFSAIHKADTFFSESTNLKEKIAEGAAAEQFFSEEDPDLTGETIGAYTLTELLGEGGMGAVYLGKRNDGQFRHSVAIKLIRSGKNRIDIHNRFIRERQILAGLSHENIARLYDGGMSEDGIPYLIMEYVDGKPIDQYCDEKIYTVKQRIELFKSVCRAAGYAHKNLVIHHDLKPENILITRNGTVKIMDFGIARLMDRSVAGGNESGNQSESKFLTFSNASPEQASGEKVTTTSDIYALGVLLYKLLCGVHPLPLRRRKTKGQLIDLIKHHSPKSLVQAFESLSESTQASIAEKRGTSPKKLCNQLNTDLNAIVLKCLSKAPHKRYQTADDLLQDLARYEKAYPLKAVDDSKTYVAKKYIARNAKPLIAATAFCLIALLSGLFYTYRMQQQRNIAQLEANKANQVTTFVLDLFKGSDPSTTGGDDVSARDLLNRGIERTEYLENQPAVKANMLEVLGRILMQLGEYDESHNLLSESIELRENHLGGNHIETVSSYEQMGTLLSARGDLFEARQVLERTLDQRKNIQGFDQSAMSEANAELAYVYRRLGMFDEAETLYRSLIETYRARLGENDPLTLKSLSSLGVTMHGKGELEEAEKIYRDVLTKREQLFDSAHPDLAMSYNNLGSLLLNRGQFEESEKYLTQSLEMRKSLFGDAHPKVALTTNNLGILKRNTGNLEEAEENFSRAMNINQELFGDKELQTAINMFSIAELHLMRENYQKAHELYRESNAIFQTQLPEGSSFIARSEIGIGESGLRQNLLPTDTAGEHILSGADRVKSIHPEKFIETGLSEVALGKYYLATDQTEEAQNHLESAYKIISDIEGESSFRSAYVEELLNENLASREE